MKVKKIGKMPSLFACFFNPILVGKLGNRPIYLYEGKVKEVNYYQSGGLLNTTCTWIVIFEDDTKKSFEQIKTTQGEFVEGEYHKIYCNNWDGLIKVEVIK